MPCSCRSAQSVCVVIFCGLLASTLEAQSPAAVEGMWSDPPNTLEDRLCGSVCSDAAIQRLASLMDDPANDARPYSALAAEALAYQRDHYIRPLMTAAALKTFPLNPATDPGFLNCEPWGVARQMVAPHQLHITRRGDRLEMRYGEWDARRIVFIDGRKRSVNEPASRLGHSVGRFAGETLVIETNGISANRMPGGLFEHSEQLQIVERYTRSDDGNRLLLTATITDPVTLREPLVLKKVWRWAPESVIAPYTECERPTEFRKTK